MKNKPNEYISPCRHFYFIPTLLLLTQVFFLNAQPITFGESISGTINPSSTILNYSISLMNGDIVFIRVSPVSGSAVNPKIELRGPLPAYKLLKTVQTTAVVKGVDLIFTIPAGEGGEHTILVTDVGQNNTGGVCISVDRFNSSPAASFLDCNSSLTSSISCNSTIKSFRYSVPANTPVQVNMAPVAGSAINPQLWVCKSDGTIIGYDSTTAVVVGISVLIPPQPTADCYYVYAADVFGNNNGGFSVSQASALCDSICTSGTTLFEICGNGIDDDNDNLTDCADPDCGAPVIQTVTAVNPTNCPALNNGSITIAASISGGASGQLLYSITGGTSYQQAAVFPGLTPGNYSVRVSNSVSGCTANYAGNPVALAGPGCSEICDNGIDDDNDGLTDCEDFDCGPANLDWLNPPAVVCPNSPFTLTLTGADANFDFELIKDNSTNPVQTKSGTGDTLSFDPLAITGATTFKIVAKSKTLPGCAFDFETNDLLVGIGDLVLIVDTIPESASNKDGMITVCLPGGVPPFNFEYEPSNRGQAGTALGPDNCSEYYEITELIAGYYKIKVTDANGCSNIVTALVGNPDKRRIGFPPSIMLTPNGDGYNDLLVFDGLFANPDKSELIITNRFGSVIYQESPYNNNWDATYNGNPVPPDTYFYYLRISEQEEITYSGYITVVR